MSENRKSWLWRLANDRDQKRINSFLDAQSNIAESMKILALYALDRFGEVDIAKHEARKLLNDDVAESVTSRISVANNNQIDKHKDNHSSQSKEFHRTDNLDDNQSDIHFDNEKDGSIDTKNPVIDEKPSKASSLYSHVDPSLLQK